MSHKSKQHDKELKLDAVQYVNEHPDLTHIECAKNLGICITTLTRWLSQYKEHEDEIPVRGSSNYKSDEQKEIARLKREMCDAQDSLDVLKKPLALWEKINSCYLYRNSYIGKDF